MVYTGVSMQVNYLSEMGDGVYRSVYARAFMCGLMCGLLCHVVNTQHLVLSGWLHPCEKAPAEVIGHLFIMYICMYFYICPRNYHNGKMPFIY